MTDKNERNILHKPQISVVGGDLRQIIAAEEIYSKGFDINIAGFDLYTDEEFILESIDIKTAINISKVIILPLPVTHDKLHLNAPYSSDTTDIYDILRSLKKDQIVIGGKFTQNMRDLAKINNIRIIDYYDLEKLQIMNSIPTAEGAIAIAINESQFTLHSSNVTVLGFGRIGKTLAHMLSALGAKVTVTARKEEDITWARVYGYKTCKTSEIDTIIESSDIIFNTIPQIILDKQLIKKLKKNALVIDLASNPGGVDYKAADEIGLKVIWALSLPGKVAPVTSGKTLSEIIISILESEGVKLL